jgi:hypothetical protein
MHAGAIWRVTRGQEARRNEVLAAQATALMSTVMPSLTTK